MSTHKQTAESLRDQRSQLNRTQGVGATSYDEVPYESRVLPYTHPASLATVGTLFGMQPPAIDRCRVLEIGCATGGNLISIATTLPDASCVGVDASARQIADGTQQIQALRLQNVQLHALDLMEIGEGFDTFDYIICHGVYSWVPTEVADRILLICSRHLSHNGIAYVSYNTYPGWHMKAMLREMMSFHVRNCSDLRQRVEEGRAFLHALAGLARDEDGIYKGLLKREADNLDSNQDHYVFHEFLEETNSPVYFHEFAELAGAKGLQYLGPARFSVWEQNLPARIAEALPLSNRIVREQYLDFIGNRTFRRSLLCHADVSLTPAPTPQGVRGMYVTANAQPVNPHPDLDSASAEEFRSESDARLSTNRPLVKIVLALLAQHYPRSVPFDSLWSMVESRLVPGNDPDAGPEALAHVLLQCHLSSMVDLSVHVAPFTTKLSECPTASPLARLQALQPDLVANLRHRLVKISDLDRLILRYLDGAHDRMALQRIVSEAVVKQEIELLDANETPVRDMESIRQMITVSIDPCLQHLATNALLVS